MKCGKCKKERKIPELRFIPNGKVPGVVNVTNYDAICGQCILEEKGSGRAYYDSIDNDKEEYPFEVATGEAPF